MSRACHQAFLLLFLSFALACAAPKAPTGGPKDEAPPVIIPEESTPNLQTFFKDDHITLTFDEWFTLKDIATQVVISPLMPEPPEITQKGKSIHITLPDSLREETTYTINFGNAIADLHEGNVLENFAFVFSTGAVLDSARLQGKVTDAATLKPAEGVWVMLQPASADSAIYKRKPDYIAKTNKEGAWSMANIRSDTFHVFALKDDNLNFLYDQVTERIGWVEEPVITDTIMTTVRELFLFDGDKPVAVRDVVHSDAGWLKIIIDAPVPKPLPVMVPDLAQTGSVWDGDTLHIWYDPALAYSGSIILGDDTTRVKPANVRVLSANPPGLAALTGRVHPAAEVWFVAKVPLVDIDTSNITVTTDSLVSLPFTMSIDSTDRRKIKVNAPWKPGARHQVLFTPGAIEDAWGRTNDTIRQSIVVNSADQFGDLTLELENLDSTRQYVLLIRNGEQIDSRFLIQQVKNTRLERKGILPAKYIIELFEDRNRNGVWDGGDYPSRRQPEPKKLVPLDNIRAAWEIETKISW